MSIIDFITDKIDVRARIIAALAVIMIMNHLILVTYSHTSRDIVRERTSQDIELLAERTLLNINEDIYYHLNDWKFIVDSSKIMREELLKSNNRYSNELTTIDPQIYIKDLSSTNKKDIIDDSATNSLAQRLKVNRDHVNSHHELEVIEEVMVTNRYGILVSQTDLEQSIYLGDKSWWINTKESGDCSNTLYYKPDTSSYVSRFCFRISNSDGNFDGVMSVVLNIQDMYKNEIENTLSSRIDPQSHITLINNSGSILYSTLSDMSKMMDYIQRDIIPEVQASGETSNSIVKEDLPNIPDLMHTYQKSPTNSVFQWFNGTIIISSPLSNVYEKLIELRETSSILTAGMIVASFIIAILIYRYISNILGDLSNSAQIVTEGNFDVKIETNYPGVLGDFASAFKRMIKKIRESTTSINRLETEIASRRKAEEIFRKTFDASPDPSFILSTGGRITRINKAFQNKLGWDIEDVEDKDINDLPFISKSVKKLVVSKLKERLSTGSVEPYEIEVKTKSGDEKWIEINASVFKIDKEPIGEIVIGRDITSRKKAEDVIENHLHQQSLLARLSINLNYYSDIHETIDDTLGEVARFSNAQRVYIYQTLVSESKKIYEWKDQGVNSLIQDKDNLAYVQNKNFVKYIKKNQIVTSDTTKLPKDILNLLSENNVKSTIILPLRANSEFFGFIGIERLKGSREWSESDIDFFKTLSSLFTNVFEREESNSSLKRQLYKINSQKNEINRIVEAIGDGLFVLDEELRIQVFNPIATRITGFKPREVIGKYYKDVLEFRLEKTDEINDKFIKRTYNTGEIQKMSNHTYLMNKKGKKIPVADSASPLIDPTGNVVGCVVVFRDVTKEREISNMKSEFVSVASHQLQTPLSGIKWLAEELQESKLDSQQKEYIGDIVGSTDRLINLVQDLLNVSHIETGRKFEIKREDTDIVQIVDQVLKTNQELADKKNISISKCSHAPDKFILNIDKEKIAQVFSNLISNAIKYSYPEGMVLIDCEKGQDKVTFMIKDEGIGIPEKEQDKIFIKFYRAQNAVTTSTEGNGLGLYIARGIIRAHGGKMWFESEEGKGTTFFFTLPR